MYHTRIDIVSQEVVEVFSAYLRGLAKICALYGFCAFVLFSILGVRYALFLGLLAGVFYAVPYIGQLVTGHGLRSGRLLHGTAFCGAVFSPGAELHRLYRRRYPLSDSGE